MIFFIDYFKLSATSSYGVGLLPHDFTLVSSDPIALGLTILCWTSETH